MSEQVDLPWGPTGRTVHLTDPTGLVRDWLVVPAFTWPVPQDHLAELFADAGDPWGAGRWVLTNGPDVAPTKVALHARHPLDRTCPDLAAVTEAGPMQRVTHDGAVREGSWQRRHTGRDGLVDWSRFCYTPEYSEGIAATAVEVDQAEWRTVEIACTGPYLLWIDGELVGESSAVSYMEPLVSRYPWRFRSGSSTIVIATWQVAFREVRHVVRLRLDGLPVQVVIPSPGADEYTSARAEALLERLTVDRWAVAGDDVELSGPAGLRLLVTPDRGAVRTVRLDAAGAAVLALDAETDEVPASMLTTSERRFTLSVDDPRSPVNRELAVGVLPRAHRTVPVGDPERWRSEVLRHAADSSAGTARALARFELDGVGPDPLDLEPALRMITSRSDCADFEAVGLLNLWHRIPAELWPDGGRGQVRDALLEFKYWIDQPGLDAMCYFTENHQFVWHTAEILVGQTFPDERFVNAGMTGREHAAHGSDLARKWLQRKLVGGFSEFDSNAYLAIDSLALASLVEWSTDDALRGTAEALLDKILLTLAANSWKGIHGSAHGRSYTPTLRSGRFEETAPMMWALWGMGSLNSAVLPVTVLTTARHYRVPPVVRAIGSGDCGPDAVWSGRQVYRGRYRRQHDLLDRPYGSDVHVWRTPDVMLSSVQDYRSGLPGLQEHIWGATLGAEIQVFATNPATDSISPSARPNAWAGQRVLPRVRQIGNAVIALHRLPADDVGGTHLWFPQPLFDEVRHAGEWLCGRSGDGYVAVTAEGGLDEALVGDGAHQSFTPNGRGEAFVCVVGGRSTHGSVDEFVASLGSVEYHPRATGEPGVLWTAADGTRAEVTWSGSPTVDGVPIDLDATGVVADPPHLSNPACRSTFGDEQLVAEWAGERLELDLRRGRRLEPASAVGTSGRSMTGTEGGSDGR